MSDYKPDPNNAVLASDAELVCAINDRDAHRLAEALETGGGSPESVYLEHLLCVLRREWKVELVRQVRGRPKGSLIAIEVQPDWQVSGLPQQVRDTLISGLRSGLFVLRRPRLSGGSRGRPAAVCSPEAIDGSHIVALARGIAAEKGVSEDEALTEAKWLWIKKWREKRDLAAVSTESEVRTAERRAKRALAKFRKLKRLAEEMQD